MKLLADIGNSRVKWCLQDGPLQGSSSVSHAVADLADILVDEWSALAPPEAVYAANVAGQDAAAAVSGFCRKHWRLDPVFLTTAKEYKGLVNAYEDIGQMGVDRWLNLVGAWTHYRGNLCVVSAGTAFTVDTVLADGRHLGGYIIPGIYLMQELLNRHTRGIKIEPGNTGLAPGTSTVECVRGGAHLAVVSLTESVLRGNRERFGTDFRCIITGGGAAVLAALLSMPCEKDPDLVFRGMSGVIGETE